MKNGCLKFRSKRILFSAIVTTALLAGSPQFVFSEVLEEHVIAQTGTVKGQVVDEMESQLSVQVCYLKEALME